MTKHTFKLERKMYKSKHLIGYRCPRCGDIMGTNLHLSDEGEEWQCKKCNKIFFLSFREIIDNKVVK